MHSDYEAEERLSYISLKASNNTTSIF